MNCKGLPWWLSGKESSCWCRRHRFDTWVGQIPWGRKWLPASVFLPRKSHGQRNLVGYTVHGVTTESDTTEWLNSNNNKRKHELASQAALSQSVPHCSSPCAWLCFSSLHFLIILWSKIHVRCCLSSLLVLHEDKDFVLFTVFSLLHTADPGTLYTFRECLLNACQVAALNYRQTLLHHFFLLSSCNTSILPSLANIRL